MEEPLESFDMQPPTPQPPFGKVLLVNFAIMLVYISSYTGRDPFLLQKASMLGIHFSVTLSLGIFLTASGSNVPVGRAFLLTSLLLPIIGFGVCVMKGKYF